MLIPEPPLQHYSVLPDFGGADCLFSVDKGQVVIRATVNVKTGLVSEREAEVRTGDFEMLRLRGH